MPISTDFSFLGLDIISVADPDPNPDPVGSEFFGWIRICVFGPGSRSDLNTGKAKGGRSEQPPHTEG